MARIAKRGLDYFPVDTHMLQNRSVRRLMKEQGDEAFGILLALLGDLYDDKGYYLTLDEAYLNYVATNFYHLTAADVRRVAEAAVMCGIFDAELYARYGILTSAAIQEQYLFCKKRSRQAVICSEYRLTATAGNDDEAGEVSAAEGINVTKKGINVTLMPQSKAKQSIAKQNKENLLLNPPPLRNDGGGEEASLGGEAEGEGKLSSSITAEAAPAAVAVAPVAAKVEATAPGPSAPGPSAPDVPKGAAKAPGTAHCPVTLAQLRALTPPADGVRRNFADLLDSMALYSIPPDEQYRIVCKSNYGQIGHPVWKGFCTLSGSGGKIRFPGRYLLSL